LRASALLGLSLGANGFLAGCARQATPDLLTAAHKTWIAAANPVIDDPTLIAAGKTMMAPGGELFQETASGTEIAQAVYTFTAPDFRLAKKDCLVVRILRPAFSE